MAEDINKVILVGHLTRDAELKYTNSGFAISKFSLFISALLFLVISETVSAHPHMWIRGQVIPELGRKGLEHVRVIWNIDELTSAAIILDYDTDRDGDLSPVETEALRRRAFEHLIEQEYYMFVEVRDILAALGRARDFSAHIEDGRLFYDFRVPLEVPIRWKEMADVRVFLFDPTYFIDFRPDDMSPMTASWKDREVGFSISSHRSLTIGYGMVDVVSLSANEAAR